MKIARSLILLMLLPLAVGLAVRARYEVVAAPVKSVLDPVSSVSLILLGVLICVVSFDKVLAIFGTRGILGGVLFIALGYIIGHLFGGPGLDRRRVLAKGTAQRNISAALLVGGQNFTDPRVVVMVIVVAMVGLAILIPLAGKLAERGKAEKG